MIPKVLFISVAPIQNVAPYIIFGNYPELESTVLYCTVPTQNIKRGNESLNLSAMDYHSLSNQYRWHVLKNFSPKPSTNKFWGLINFSIIKYIIKNNVVFLFSHAYFTFILAIILTRLLNKKLVLSTDATYIESPDNKKWKKPLKKFLFPILYNHIAHHVLVPSTTSADFLVTLGVKADRISNGFYSVDNEYIQSISRNVNVAAFRKEANIPLDAFVFVFCAKFLPRKRPADAIKAFAKASLQNARLIMIGDGPLRDELIILAKELEVSEHIIFPGLVKYSVLPYYYTSSNVLIFASEIEQFGLPVNEAMNCHIPVLISDRIGARKDLVMPGETGYIYSCGNIDQLATYMKKISESPEQCKLMGEKAFERINQYSPAYTAAKMLKIVRTLKKQSVL